jgi:hypothetical protein
MKKNGKVVIIGSTYRKRDKAMREVLNIVIIVVVIAIAWVFLNPSNPLVLINGLIMTEMWLLVILVAALLARS